MENDDDSPIGLELRSAMRLYVQYVRMLKEPMDRREDTLFRQAIVLNITNGGTCSLVRGENGIEFRIHSKLKEVKPTKPRSKSNESKPRSRQQKDTPAEGVAPDQGGRTRRVRPGA